MQTEAAVAMGRRPVDAIESGGAYHGFGAIPPKRADRPRGKAVTGRCIWKG